jgi:agmatine deiminase
VLVPTFNDPHDRIALGLLAELFPTRTVSASTPSTFCSASAPSTPDHEQPAG